MAAIEETIPVTIEQEVVTAPATEVSPTEEKTAGDGGKLPLKTKGRKPKSVSAKKARSPPAHPPYVEMITEALTTLKEKNGSSQYAIQKFVEENHKNLPPNFRKLLLGNLRKLTASGRLVKVKNSFKLPSKTASKTAEVKPKPAAVKPKKTAVKPKKAVSSAVKPKKAVAAAVKPKSGRKTAAAAAVTAKAKAVKAAKAKPAGKAKVVVTAAVAKPKLAGTKRKAVAVVVKPKEKAAKVAKTAAKSTPSKKAAPIAKVAKVAPKSVKSVKPKSVKSPAKRAMPRRGKK